MTDERQEPDPVQEFFDERRQAERERNSQLYAVRDVVKASRAVLRATKRIDWIELGEQVVGMTPVDRDLLDSSAAMLEVSAREIRKLLKPSLEIVKAFGEAP